MNKCLVEHFLLVLIVVVSWSILFFFAFNAPNSKYSHLLDYDEYRTLSTSMQESSVVAFESLKQWKENNFVKLGLKTPDEAMFNQRTTAPKYLCLSIMTKNRIGSKVNYLNQLLMSILTRTYFRHQRDILIRVFNTENQAQNHRHVFDYANLVEIVNLTSQVRNSNLRVKEALDFTLVLEHLHSLRCNYSIVLEDDALVSYFWYERLQQTLADLAKTKQCWLYLKLFTGYKFFDWDWLVRPGSIMRVFIYSMLMFLVQVVVVKFTCMNELNGKRRRLLFYLLVNAVALMVVFHATSTHPSGHGVHEYATGFGMVAMLYRRETLLNLSDYIKTVVNDYVTGRSNFFEPKDLLLERYRNQTGCAEFILEPSLFQHTGMHSSLYQRDTSIEGYYLMRKSFSFIDNSKRIVFDENFLLS